MRVVLQRVSNARVTIDADATAEISHGLLILLGIEHDDGTEDADWLINKITSMRIFNDEKGKMNVSILEINGSALVVSQFTLHASTRKGNRPSFIKAAKPEHAVPLYSYFIAALEERIPVETGEFGADMKVELTNDGPVTILVDSKNRE